MNTTISEDLNPDQINCYGRNGNYFSARHIYFFNKSRYLLSLLSVLKSPFDEKKKKNCFANNIRHLFLTEGICFQAAPDRHLQTNHSFSQISLDNRHRHSFLLQPKWYYPHCFQPLNFEVWPTGGS